MNLIYFLNVMRENKNLTNLPLINFLCLLKIGLAFNSSLLLRARRAPDLSVATLCKKQIDQKRKISSNLGRPHFQIYWRSIFICIYLLSMEFLRREDQIF